MQTLANLNFEVKTIENAPEGARELLENTQKKMGMVPNMYGVMAHAPALLNTYLHGYNLFRQQTSFSSQEQEVILLSISYVNQCHYCMAAHSFLADNVSNVPEEVTNAIRNGEEVSDTKLGPLSRFVQVMVEKRGFPSPEEVDAFLDAGYRQEQILEIVLAISVKTISNYSNHLANTPVDDTFKSREWAAE